MSNIFQPTLGFTNNTFNFTSPKEFASVYANDGFFDRLSVGHGGNIVPIVIQGTFALTFGGGIPSTVVTVKFTVTGNQITLFFPVTAGAASANLDINTGITTIPSQYRPVDEDPAERVCLVINDGANNAESGVIQIFADGSMNFRRLTAAGNFTGTNQNGFRTTEITYRINPIAP